MRKTILFDLDGTLLPMNQSLFLQTYLQLLAQEMIAHGYEPQTLLRNIMRGTELMLQNDGMKTNEEVFWDYFAEVYHGEVRNDERKFHDFYVNAFPQVQKVCGYNPAVAPLIEKLKAQGFKLVVATNPIFPRVATHERLRWAGLNPHDFVVITTYENSSFSKPNAQYYQEILTTINEKPENVLMVGNDTSDDLGALRVGIDIYFVVDNLINKNNVDLTQYKHGSFSEFTEYLNL